MKIFRIKHKKTLKKRKSSKYFRETCKSIPLVSNYFLSHLVYFLYRWDIQFIRTNHNSIVYTSFWKLVQGFEYSFAILGVYQFFLIGLIFQKSLLNKVKESPFDIITEYRCYYLYLIKAHIPQLLFKYFIKLKIRRHYQYDFLS